MLLKIEHEIFLQQHPERTSVPILAMRQLSLALADEIVKFIVYHELPRSYNRDYTNKRRLTAEVHVLPPSQYEKVMGLLRQLKGISPEVDFIVRQIASEL